MQTVRDPGIVIEDVADHVLGSENVQVSDRKEITAITAREITENVKESMKEVLANVHQGVVRENAKETTVMCVLLAMWMTAMPLTRPMKSVNVVAETIEKKSAKGNVPMSVCAVEAILAWSVKCGQEMIANRVV